MDPVSALIGAGASLLGGFLSNRSTAKSVASSNQMSLEQMREQNNFNAWQSELDYTRSSESMREANALNRANMGFANELQRGQNLEQMQFQDAQAKQQMAFQERLANTSHQREVLDLRAAGLNPILSGTGGMGAVTPAGAMGSGHAGGPGASSVSPVSARGHGSGSAQFGSARFSDIVSPAVSTALQTMQAIQSVKLGEEQVLRTQAETLRTVAEAERIRTQADLDPTFAREERLQGVRKTEGEASTAQAEGERRTWLKHVDRQMIEKEREAELGYLAQQTRHMKATARSAEVTADLDEELKDLERMIRMGQGASSALRELLMGAGGLRARPAPIILRR